PLAVHGQVQKGFLGRLVAREVASVPVHFRQPPRLEPAEARIGRRDQNAVLQPGTDVARAAAAIAPFVKGAAVDDDPFPQLLFVHDGIPSAWMKKLASIPNGTSAACTPPNQTDSPDSMGGKTPSAISCDRWRTRCVRFMPSTTMVARPTA